MIAPDVSKRPKGDQFVADAVVVSGDETRKMGGVLMDAITFWGHQLTNEGAMR